MADALHAFDYLAQPEKHPPAAVCVLYGDEAFLRRLVLDRLRRAVLGDDDEEAPFAALEGPTAEWRDVHDELATVSLFGSSQRLVVVEDADTLVSRYRQQLEAYVAKSSKNGVLVLAVASWPANTRLYKAVAAGGLAIQCGLPSKGGRSKAVDETRLIKWLAQWAKVNHQLKLDALAVEELLALTGPELGLMDQNLAKLALFADEGGKVAPELVREVVGGWRAKSVWELGDAAAAGNAAEALVQLDHILAAGDHPNAIFGQLAWSLRRFAAATQVIEQRKRQRNRVDLDAVLQEAGFRPWPKDALQQAGVQLKQLGRRRAGSLYRWLLETDLALKGTHSQPQRGRLKLEKLLVGMSQQADPRVER